MPILKVTLSSKMGGKFYINGKADFLEVTIRDYSGAKIEIVRCSLGDKVAETKLFKYLYTKYGFSPDLNNLKEEKSNEILDFNSEFLDF